MCLEDPLACSTDLDVDLAVDLVYLDGVSLRDMSFIFSDLLEDMAGEDVEPLEDEDEGFEDMKAAVVRYTVRRNQLNLKFYRYPTHLCLLTLCP